jgi:decaprenylphospho-beta-D-ribofuranose 2-oxidase
VAPTRTEGINLRGIFRFPVGRYADKLLPSGAAPKMRGPPFELPELFLNRVSIRAVNRAIQWLQKRSHRFAHYEGFFYPLDGILHWNRGYGPRGFTQYQFVIPFADAERNLRELLTVILTAGELPFLNVLKRLGNESGGLISFPQEGYTLVIDFPVRTNTVSLLRQLHRMLLDVGGRVYLAKDSFLEASTFRAMYPRFTQWLKCKETFDPSGVFKSNLGRRLALSV